MVSARRWNPRDYRCAVLQENVQLTARGTEHVVGYLKKGAVLFVPDREDMAVTDPGDAQLHKIYVCLSADIMDHVVFLPDSRHEHRFRPGEVHDLMVMSLATNVQSLEYE